MLERNGIQCWITTAEHILLPEILTSTGESDIVTCTVKLQTRKSYIIHWLSTSPLTAWCEVHTKSPNGKTTKGVAKCEMDAANPQTQRRSSHEGTSTGRNLGFYGRRISSINLGMAWLEIRRATSIKVIEVAKGERQLTVDWVPSDHPGVGTPYTTFVFNFMLVGALAEGSTSPSTPRPVHSPGSTQPYTLRRVYNSFTGQEQDDKSALRSLIQNSAGPSTSSHVYLPSPSTSRSIRPTASSSLNAAAITNSGDTGPINVVSSETDIATSPHQAVQQANIHIPEVVIDPGPSRKRESLYQFNISHIAKRPRLNGPSGSMNAGSLNAGPVIVDPELEKLHMRALGESDTENNDQENYTVKNVRIETEIDSHVQKFALLHEKEKYMRAKQEWVQLLADIRSAELDCGPLSPNKSFFQDWTSTYDSDEDDGFAAKRGKIGDDLPVLRNHLLALTEKKRYHERKATLRKLKVDIQAVERRCDDLSSNISRIIASTQTPRSSES